MPFLLLAFIALVTLGVYFGIDFLMHFRSYLKKINWKAAVLAVLAGVGLLSLIIFLIIKTEGRGGWCDKLHVTNNYPPAETISAMDYFEKANYEYDYGKCDEAVADYTTSIELNPLYPQAYNNRAYTYMRMEKYEEALADLNQALMLNPDYTNALMNRADVLNYHLNKKEEALIDYQKLIELGAASAACNHMFDAKYEKFSLQKILAVPSMIMSCGK